MDTIFVFLLFGGVYLLFKYLRQNRQWSVIKSIAVCIVVFIFITGIYGALTESTIPENISYTTTIPGTNQSYTYEIVLEEGGRGRFRAIGLGGWNNLRYDAYVDPDKGFSCVIMHLSDIAYCGGSFPQSTIYYRDEYVYPEQDDMMFGRKKYGLKVTTSGSLHLTY